jgi:hypothetical protein
MIGLMVLALGFQKADPNPLGAFDGIWKSTAGDALVFEQSHLWVSTAAETLVARKFNATPQGSWFGQWDKRKTLLGHPAHPAEFIRHDFFDNTEVRPERGLQSFIGIAELFFPQPDATGTVAQFRMQLSSDRGVKHSATDYYWLGPLGSASIGGTYSGEQVTLKIGPGTKSEIIDQDADPSTVATKPRASIKGALGFTGKPFSGEVTVAGVTYYVEGVFQGARGQFRSYFPRTANPAYRGRIFWTPTQTQVKTWQRGGSYNASTITLYLGSGPGLPSGKRAVLTLQ